MCMRFMVGTPGVRRGLPSPRGTAPSRQPWREACVLVPLASCGPRAFARDAPLAPRWVAPRGAIGRATRAAVFGQIPDQVVHDHEIRGIDELAAVALLRDEAGTIQMLQVERQ